ncbi:uncharacterized protein BDZ99DRAFT_514902 [Mytilinidion resinicola]|uniref:Uncharacterized protein n=1 Tax=Mytilinidion resinicola TaxID=574789 RepID=A0A6A6Z5D3_9PEZI|nr:uncharacterized protein BDZ99DRAFT_514902 [Mytilinidion resinicola]KAF2816306.1 hypothetical protein BDZ99DRAFT_514902 [Mytilinidion resinicola]
MGITNAHQRCHGPGRSRRAAAEQLGRRGAPQYALLATAAAICLLEPSSRDACSKPAGDCGQTALFGFGRMTLAALHCWLQELPSPSVFAPQRNSLHRLATRQSLTLHACGASTK